MKYKFILILFIIVLIINVDVLAIGNSLYLKILRIESVGLEPAFSPEINEYYYVVDDSVDNLGITAIPMDNEVSIEISGNENLKLGMNVINIFLENKYTEENNQYYIYVSKTKNKEQANSNLETLAVRQGELSTVFDKNVLNYNLEISNNTYRLDILAIAEMPNASVEIIGNDDIKVGDNIVEIRVIAEDGISFKRYYLNVHRRSVEEDIIYTNNQKMQAERLASIMNSKKIGNSFMSNTSTNFSVIVGTVTILIGFCIGGILYWIKRKMH